MSFKAFSKAVENHFNDVKIDPYLLVFKLFKTFFNQKQRVYYEDIETFFGEFNSYFIQKDIEVFLFELSFIKRDREESKIVA